GAFMVSSRSGFLRSRLAQLTGKTGEILPAREITSCEHGARCWTVQAARAKLADVGACSLAALLHADAHAARVAPLACRARPAAAHRHGVDPGGSLPGQNAVSQHRSPGRCRPAHRLGDDHARSRAQTLAGPAYRRLLAAARSLGCRARPPELPP